MNDSEKQSLVASKELRKAGRALKERRRTVQTRIELSLHGKLKAEASRRKLTISKLLDTLLKISLRTLSND